MILFIKHIDIEGPETLGNFFLKNGFDIKEIDLSLGEKLPQDLTGIDAVVSLGGPMNVYDGDKYPFLIQEDAFIKRILEENMPFLGLCLGSQILAKASGGKVIKSPQKEVGFSQVVLNQYGLKDPFFKGLNIELEVFQWHEDMFEVPNGGILLAGSKDCPNQAFRVGKCAYGLQFHMEITEKSIREWSDRYFNLSKTSSLQKKEEMLKDYGKKQENFSIFADNVYNNFLKIINNNKIEIG